MEVMGRLVTGWGKWVAKGANFQEAFTLRVVNVCTTPRVSISLNVTFLASHLPHLRLGPAGGSVKICLTPQSPSLFWQRALNNCNHCAFKSPLQQCSDTFWSHTDCDTFWSSNSSLLTILPWANCFSLDTKWIQYLFHRLAAKIKMI